MEYLRKEISHVRNALLKNEYDKQKTNSSLTEKFPERQKKIMIRKENVLPCVSTIRNRIERVLQSIESEPYIDHGETHKQLRPVKSDLYRVPGVHKINCNCGK